MKKPHTEKLYSIKPTKCPVCGGKVAEIIYGDIDPRNKQLKKEMREQKIIWSGSCERSVWDSKWMCVKCNTEFWKGK